MFRCVCVCVSKCELENAICATHLKERIWNSVVRYPKTPKMRRRGPQDSLKRFQDAPETPEDAPKTPQDLEN